MVVGKITDPFQKTPRRQRIHEKGGNHQQNGEKYTGIPTLLNRTRGFLRIWQSHKKGSCHFLKLFPRLQLFEHGKALYFSVNRENMCFTEKYNAYHVGIAGTMSYNFHGLIREGTCSLGAGFSSFSE